MTTTGYAGHSLPMVPLALALQGAGHELRIAGPRSRGESLEQFGLPFHGVYDAPEAQIWALGRATYELPYDDANARVLRDGFGRAETRAAISGLLDLAESWRPDLIVRESYEFAGALVAELRDIPHARIAVGVGGIEPWLFEHAAEPIDEVRGMLGLRRDPRAERLSATPYLTLTPQSLEDPRLTPPADTWRFRPGGTTRTHPLPDWWPGDERPLVYVSFGTVAGELGMFPKFYRAAAGALGELPIRVLMTVGNKRNPAHLGPLPSNVHVERWVPQGDVMQHASVTVAHGGYGSTLQSLAGGVPMVIMPLFTDHNHIAERVVEAGAGLQFARFVSFRETVEKGPAMLVANLRQGVESVLGAPRYRSAARRIADDIASLPSADVMAARLTDYCRVPAARAYA